MTVTPGQNNHPTLVKITTAIAQARFDAMEIDDPEAAIHAEIWITEPGRAIREYRFRFNQKRRELIRDAMVELIDAFDANVREIRGMIGDAEANEHVDPVCWSELRSRADQIKVLLGSSVQQPAAWPTFACHLHFGMVCDFNDIEKYDWPARRACRGQSLIWTQLPRVGKMSALKFRQHRLRGTSWQVLAINPHPFYVY
jgi:hypothetical protein